MHDRDPDETAITNAVIGAFFDVYNALGFGFLEHVYSLALARELGDRGHHVGREVTVPIEFKGEILTHQRVDMIIDDRVLVEVNRRTSASSLKGRWTVWRHRGTGPRRVL